MNNKTNLCQCTSPQPTTGKTWCKDNMCICGYPLHNDLETDYDWFNDSGYSDVFHNEYSLDDSYEYPDNHWTNTERGD